MKTVMLVDDERPARELVKMTINWEKAGFQILWEARNGKQALEQYAEKKPDLIITDIQMPVMDGLELLERVKAICPSQKVVILSCHEDFSYARRALRAGVLDYLIKDALTDEVLYNLLESLDASPEEDFPREEALPGSPGILKNALSDNASGLETAEKLLDAYTAQKQDFSAVPVP